SSEWVYGTPDLPPATDEEPEAGGDSASMATSGQQSTAERIETVSEIDPHATEGEPAGAEDAEEESAPPADMAQMVDPMERARAALEEARRQMPGLLGIDDGRAPEDSTYTGQTDDAFEAPRAVAGVN